MGKNDKEDQKSDGDDPLDALYAAPLSEFIATRGRLAAELKASGDKEGAAFLKTAVKPSASAWAVNQAVRRSPRALAHLIEASDHLAETQLRATGSEAKQRYQEAVAAHRQAIDTLVDEAAEALAGEKQKASPDLRERIAGNFRWAPQTQESRLLLRAGRLTKDLGPQDFGALARLAGGKGLDDGALAKVIPLGRLPSPQTEKTEKTEKARAAPARPADKAAAAKAKEKEARQRRKDELADRKAEVRARHQESQQAEKQHAKLAGEIEKLETRRDELESELSETRQSLEQARSEARRSEGALARAKLAEQKAADAVAALEDEDDEDS